MDQALIMRDARSLAGVLKSLWSEVKTTRVDQYAFRSIALGHFLPPNRPDPLFAAIPGPLGTRFLPPNHQARSLYVASNAETAHREGNQIFYQTSKTPGSDPSTLFPPTEAVLISVHLHLDRVLDLRDPEIMARLKTDALELVSPWKSVRRAPTQRLGAAVEAAGGFDGILYDSAQNPGNSCFMILPDRLTPGSFVDFQSRTSGIPDTRLGLAKP